jgi:hypothetical protein
MLEIYRFAERLSASEDMLEYNLPLASSMTAVPVLNISKDL